MAIPLGGALVPAQMTSPAAATAPQVGASSALADAIMNGSGGMGPLQNAMSGSWGGGIPLSTIAQLAQKNGGGSGQGLFGLGGAFGPGGFFDNLFTGGYGKTAGTGVPADQFGDAIAAGYPISPS